MADQQKMVVTVTNGVDNERASVAWSVANGGVGMGFEVTMFLVSAGVDWARKGAAEKARPNPLDPTIGEMMANVMSNGGQVLVCPPCAAVRGYEEDDLIEGATLAGSAAMLAVAAQNAITLTF
ncbi:MAG TPA: DsrE family protein [Gemmatimonadota bacterium]|nr:DsrE family protein [Gemmatimonadota bacterium]